MLVLKGIKHCIQASLVAVLLVLSPALPAQDVEGFIEQNALSHYPVDPGEHTRARAGDGYTFSVLGSRWGFFNQYDDRRQRIWRSAPFRVDICRTDAMLGSWGPASEGYFQLDPGIQQTAPRLRCPEGLTRLFLLLPDHSVIGVQIEPGSGDKGKDDIVQPILTWNLLASPSTPEQVTRQIMAQWRKQPLWVWSAGMKKVLSPQQIRIRMKPVASEQMLRRRHRQALQIWQRRPSAIDNSQRASKALAALEPELSRIDPRSLPDTDIGMLNDIGFWLQQEGGCGSSNDAIAVLQTVLRRDPDRTPAYLNLAQAMQGAEHCPLNLGRKVSMQESARQYCQRQGIENIPGNIAAQLSSMLDVPALEPQVCRPRLDLFRAVQARDLVGLQQALDAHPEDLQQVSADGRLVLSDAVRAGWLEGASALLAAGADPDDSVPRSSDSYKYASSPLELAIADGNREMVMLLLGSDAELDPVIGRKPLIVAAGKRSEPALQARDTAIVRDLLDAGKRGYGIGSTDADGNTALMAAAASGNLATARLLLKYKDTPSLLNAVNKYGENVLHQVMARSTDDVAMWRWLLQQGANPNQQNNWGRTPLMHLFTNSGGDDDLVVSMLAAALDYHPDLGLADNDQGRRLLDFAVDDVNERAVAMLLKAGAAPCVDYNHGRSSMKNVELRIQTVSSYSNCQQDPASCSALQDLKKIKSLLNCPLPGDAPQ